MTPTNQRERLTQLYTEHWRELFAYAMRRCPTSVDAAEIVSDVFLVAWRRIGSVPHGAEAKLWLYGVARHTLANELRKHHRRDRAAVAHLALLADPTPDPAELLQHNETERAILVALTRLSAADQELLRLVAWEELTPSEAATVLGVSPATARVRLTRARRRLTAAIDAPPPERPHPVTSTARSTP